MNENERLKIMNLCDFSKVAPVNFVGGLEKNGSELSLSKRIIFVVEVVKALKSVVSVNVQRVHVETVGIDVKAVHHLTERFLSAVLESVHNNVRLLSAFFLCQNRGEKERKRREKIIRSKGGEETLINSSKTLGVIAAAK